MQQEKIYDKNLWKARFHYELLEAVRIKWVPEAQVVHYLENVEHHYRNFLTVRRDLGLGYLNSYLRSVAIVLPDANRSENQIDDLLVPHSNQVLLDFCYRYHYDQAALILLELIEQAGSDSDEETIIDEGDKMPGGLEGDEVAPPGGGGPGNDEDNHDGEAPHDDGGQV